MRIGAERIRFLLVGSIVWAKWTEIAVAAAVCGAVGVFHYVFRDRFELATVLSAVLATVSLSAEPAAAQGDLDPCDLHMGDVDGSGDVTVYDGYTLLSWPYGQSGSFYAGVADVNGDGRVNMSDAIYIFNFVNGGPSPVSSVPRGDANGDGSVDIADLVTLGQWMWGGSESVCVSGADINADTAIDLADFIVMLELF